MEPVKSSDNLIKVFEERKRDNCLEENNDDREIHTSGISCNPSAPEDRKRGNCLEKNNDDEEIHKSAISCNPSAPTDEGDQVNEDLARIRGDAIGNTLYSERFVLSTLLKLTKIEKELAENERFENDLCSLWDMTIEEDVVLLLLEHNVLELFAHCINATEDKRLAEILIGILGNMCNFKQARDSLAEDSTLVQALLDLTNCSDSLTLLQLMRLFSVVLIHADRKAAKQWYKRVCNYTDFVKNIAFILTNSINEQLLRQTIETLNAILAKFALVETNEVQTGLPTFEELFVNESLIKATIETFLSLLPRKDGTEYQEENEDNNTDVNDDDEDDSIILLTQNTHNLMQIFLNIHSILTQYNDSTHKSYNPHIESLMDCLSCILQPLSNPKYVQYLSNREQDLLDSVNDILQSLGDPFDERCLMFAINIWNLLRVENERLACKTPTINDFEEISVKEDEFNFETSYLSILDLIVRMMNAASESQLAHVWKENLDDNMKYLQNKLSIGENDQPIKQCYYKILKTLENKQKT